MLRSAWQFARVGPVCVLATLLAAHPNLLAQSHVVSPAELQKKAVAATRAREEKVATVTKFLSSPTGKKALRSAHLDPRRVKTAVSALGDEELAQLASRAEKAQADFAAGRMSDRDLLLILIGFVALILIIVAVR